MSTHWPLGRGSYARSLVHTSIAAAVGAICLFLAIVFLGVSYRHEPDVLAACLFWTLPFSVALALQWATLVLFRPSLLAMLVPTPAGEMAIHQALDPARSVACAAVPYVLAILAIFLCAEEQAGTLATIAAFFYASMFYRLFLPVAFCIAVRFRKFLVPWGHWVMWLVTACTVTGVLSQVPRIGDDVLGLIYPVYPPPGVISVLVAIALGYLARPVRRCCARYAARHIRRAELMELAYPVNIERAAKPRKTLLEMIGGNKRRRRLVFLLQEATSLYRPADCCKALAVWLLVFVGITLVLRGESGSGPHIAITLVPVGGAVIWSFVARMSFERMQLVWALNRYGPPVGHLELFAAKLLAVSPLYFLTGVLAFFLFVSTGAGGGATWGAFASATGVNLVQVWLIVVALWASLPAEALDPANPRRGFRGGMVFALKSSLLTMPFMIGAADLAAGHAIFGASPWGHLYSNGLRTLLRIIRDMCGGGLPFLGGTYGPLGSDPYQRVLLELLTWALLVLVLLRSLRRLHHTGRGRAHPSYRASFKVASPLHSLFHFRRTA